MATNITWLKDLKDNFERDMVRALKDLEKYLLQLLIFMNVILNICVKWKKEMNI